MRNRFRNLRLSNRGFISGRNFRILGVIIFVVLLIFFIRSRVRPSSSAVTASQQSKNTGEVTVRASQELNKEFTFPIKDKGGSELGSIKFVISSVELRDQIIVKGKKATSADGRTFLVLSLKITNSFERMIQINTRDYVRLSVDGNENEWLAPDVHNDPVEVQAISTKPTRVAFPVDITSQKFVLQVGEIKGAKEKVELSIRP